MCKSYNIYYGLVPRSKTTTNQQQQQQQRNTQYHPTPDGMRVRPNGGSRGWRVSKTWLGFQLQRRSFSADGVWGNNIMSTIKTRNNDKPCYSHISRIRIVITPKPKQTPSTSTHAFSKYTLYIGTNLCFGNVYKDILLHLLRESTQKNAGSTLRGLTQKTKKESESVFF